MKQQETTLESPEVRRTWQDIITHIHAQTSIIHTTTHTHTARHCNPETYTHVNNNHHAAIHTHSTEHIIIVVTGDYGICLY